jgi:hypothetical protein
MAPEISRFFSRSTASLLEPIRRASRASSGVALSPSTTACAAAPDPTTATGSPWGCGACMVATYVANIIVTMRNGITNSAT